MHRTLVRLTRARPHELRASLWAFVFFFALLAGYYVLRPIRDEMAVQVGQAGLSALFTWVLVSMLVMTPVFGALAARIPRKQRATLVASYALTSVTTFYTRHGDWFAYACAIISLGALFTRFTFSRNRSTNRKKADASS